MSARETVDVTGVLITSPGNVSVENLQIHEAQGDELAIRVELCGICTPEQRVYRGQKAVYPYWGGHEVCGIVETGHANGDFSPPAGTRVAVALMSRCGACVACRTGLDNHCAYLHVAQHDNLPAGPRGFSNRLVVPRYKAFPIPQHVPPERAALVEPFACCLRSIVQSGVSAGDTVVVLGTGTMGLLHIIGLRLFGCSVLAVDRDVATHAAAFRAGATRVSSDASQIAADLNELTTGWGAAAVYCTRGGVSSVNSAVELVARGGRVILYQSITSHDEVRLSLNNLHYREVQLIGSIAQTVSNLSLAVNLLAANIHAFDCLNIVIHELSDAPAAFRQAVSGQVNRAMIDFRRGS